MKAEDTINRIRGALGPHLAAYEQKSENRVYIEVRPETVIEAAQLMFEEEHARLQIATGVDTGEGIEVMYHWALDTEDCVVTVRVTVPYETPQLESIAGICPAAEWIEREMWELLGVEFAGHPDMRHLLLSDDWPKDNYPLRKKPSQLVPLIPESAQPHKRVNPESAQPHKRVIPESAQRISGTSQGDDYQNSRYEGQGRKEIPDQVRDDGCVVRGDGCVVRDDGNGGEEGSS